MRTTYPSFLLRVAHCCRSMGAAIAAGCLALGLCACSASNSQNTTASDANLARTQQQVQKLHSHAVSFIGIGPFGGFLSALESDTRDTLSQVGYSVSYSSTNRKDHLAQVEQFEKALNGKPDAIILAPTQNTGWRGELLKAQSAHIPVILIAHHLSRGEERLATTYVGPSDTWAGRQCAKYVDLLYSHGLRSDKDARSADPAVLNGVVLAGATGQRQSEERTKGWANRIKRNNHIHVLSTVPGDWTQGSAYTTMAGLLSQYSERDIRFVFAESDAMGIGATEAISDAGLTSRIHVVSIDGTKAGLQAVIDGSIDRSVEYNPLIGSKVSETLTRILEGKKVAREVTVPSQVFDANAARAALPTRKY